MTEYNRGKKNGVSGYERNELDFYIEPEWIVEALLEHEVFKGTSADPFAGTCNIPKVYNRVVLTEGRCYSSDIIRRCPELTCVDDFFDKMTYKRTYCNIVTNPPYKNLQSIIDICLERTTNKVAILTRLAFLEGQARREWWARVPLKKVWVSSRRVSMPPGEKLLDNSIKPVGGTIAYAWFVFEHGYVGNPEIGWI